MIRLDPALRRSLYGSLLQLTSNNLTQAGKGANKNVEAGLPMRLQLVPTQRIRTRLRSWTKNWTKGRLQSRRGRTSVKYKYKIEQREQRALKRFDVY